MNNHQKINIKNEALSVEIDGLECSLLALEMACTALPADQRRAMQFLVMTARDHATHLRHATHHLADKTEGESK